MNRENILYCSKVENLEILWETDALKGKKRVLHGFFSEVFYYLPFSEGIAKIDIKTGCVTIINTNGFDYIGGKNNTLRKLLFNYPKSKYMLFDFVAESSLWEISSINVKGLGYHVFEDHLIRCKKSFITNLDFTDGTIKWQIDLNAGNSNHDFTIKSVGFITALNDRIYLAVNSRHIFVLNLQTGEKLKTISKLPEGKVWRSFNKEFDFLPYIGSAVCISAQNKIVGLSFSYYWELDVLTDEVTFWDYTESFDTLSIRAATDDHIASKVVQRGGKLYFLSVISNKETNIRESKLVCFDTKSRAVVDSYKFDIASNVNFLGRMMGIENNWLKIGTSDGITFIFDLEKQNSESL